MNAKDNYIENTDTQIKNKVRGEISHYSISQVADLLNEDVANIKYYTNIFDDILNIEIVNKELEYKNEDINKLEFLIKLKNKGMSLKEIHEYYNKISFSEEEVTKKTSNLLSVEDLISEIITAQNDNFINLKNDLINDIKKNNDDYLQNLSRTLLEKQEESFNDLKQTLSKEIKEHISENFTLHNEQSLKLSNDFLDKTTEFISEKITECNKELCTELHKDFEDLSNASLTDNKDLLKEVKSFKRVMQDAYYMNIEMQESNENNKSFFKKIASLFSDM